MKTLLVPLACLCLMSCSSNDSKDDKDQGADTQPQEDTAVDKKVEDDAKPPVDTVAPDGTNDGNAETEIENPFGFVMRIPVKHKIACETTGDPMPGSASELDEFDADWICTFVHGETKGFVYVQSTPVECQALGLSTGAKYESKGFMSIDGKVTELADAYYDWGGNHRNDEMGFDHDGQHYRYYHSSFGFGWRKCHPMDCMQVLKTKAGETIEDGCTSDRTLPVVCLQVTEESKAFAEVDFEDTFEKCPGDDSDTP